MSGKAPPDRPAFQPYWGKPAVRNERGDRGNVGIIRSPVRASILPNLRTDQDRVLLRFVEGRPVSRVTTDFLAWGADRLAAEGKRVWVLVWDNAAWHVSRAVQAWIGAHNRTVKRTGGVRILVCRLPVKSPWLNPAEPLLGFLPRQRAAVQNSPDRLAAASQPKALAHPADQAAQRPARGWVGPF